MATTGEVNGSAQAGPSTDVPSTMRTIFIDDGLLMYDTVVELGEFCFVPAVGRSYEVAGDSLQAVDGMAAAVRTCFEFGRSILVSAVHAAVACMVDRAVSDIVGVHKVYNRRYGIGIVGRISINLHIEYMSASGECVVGCFHLSFVAGEQW